MTDKTPRFVRIKRGAVILYDGQSRHWTAENDVIFEAEHEPSTGRMRLTSPKYRPIYTQPSDIEIAWDRYQQPDPDFSPVEIDYLKITREISSP